MNGRSWNVTIRLFNTMSSLFTTLIIAMPQIEGKEEAFMPVCDAMTNLKKLIDKGSEAAAEEERKRISA